MHQQVTGVVDQKIANGRPVKREKQDERQELGDEAHGLFVDRRRSLDHGDNEPDHQHDYQRRSSDERHHPKRLAHRNRKRAVGLHLSPVDDGVAAASRCDLWLLRGERHGTRSVYTRSSFPHPLAPAPRCDPWAPELSILLGDGLHLNLRSDAVYPSRPTAFLKKAQAFEGRGAVPRNRSDGQGQRKAGMYDCVIIGGGPAGLTAATYLARFLRSTLVIDAGDGRATRIPTTHNLLGFPDGISGDNLLVRMHRHAAQYGAELVTGIVDRIDRVGTGFVVHTNAKTFSLSYSRRSVSGPLWAFAAAGCIARTTGIAGVCFTAFGLMGFSG